MELRSSSQEGIHRDRGGFNNNLSSHSLPKEGSSSKLSAAAAAAASNILATTVTDRRRSHGGSSSTSTVLNQHPPQQTLDPHLPHPHPLLLPDPQYSNNLPHPQTNSNPDPQDLIAPPPPPPPSPPPSNDEPIIISSTSTTTASASVQYIYGECLKNHAASTGGHVVDGCGEFMPRGEENTPEALRCAACDCHRNFHRREVQGQGEENNNINSIITPQIPSAGNNNNHTSQRTTNSHHHLLLQHQQHHNAGRYGAHGGPIPLPPVMMAFRGGGAAEYSSSEDLNAYYDSNNNNNNNNNDDGGTTTQARGKKRYRTKFSQGQKERMQEFAERVLGWKMQKQDDEQVEKFCEEVGVKRQVFKVWMHNNKAAAINKNKPH